MRRRGALFAVFAAACVVVAALAVVLAAGSAPSPEPASTDDAALDVAALDAPLIFRNAERASRDRVAYAEARGAGKRYVTSLRCRRVHFAGGRGLCLDPDDYGIGLHAKLLDRHLEIVDLIPLPGLPSRARVSADGRWAAATTFVTGDSYAKPGTFSTRTKIIDMKSGGIVDDLEAFTARRDGEVVDVPDTNFWGVTFARDGDTFYATMATGGKTYLMRGSISERSLEALRENVECPSLSPDGTRIAYKFREPGSSKAVWHLHVLELSTMRDVALSEPRSVDDQAEWLDDEHVLYGSGRRIMSVAADGTGRPRRVLAHADSPAVVASLPGDDADDD